MSNVERLDFSEPPPGDYMTPCIDGAIAAAWAHYKARHDPPGMWTGFNSVLPDCVQRTPRMGIAVRGLAMLELHAGQVRFDSVEAAKSAARAAAWAWYERRLALAKRLGSHRGSLAASLLLAFMGGGSSDLQCRAESRHVWPLCLVWPNDQVAEVERWLAEGGEVPEVLRGS